MNYKNLSDDADRLWKYICKKNIRDGETIELKEASDALGGTLASDQLMQVGNELNYEGLVEFKTDNNTGFALVPKGNEVQKFNEEQDREKIVHSCRCGKGFDSFKERKEHQKQCRVYQEYLQKNKDNPNSMFS